MEPTASPITPKRILAFGPFILDLDHRRLLRDGDLVRLTAKPFDTLAFLAQQSGQLVTRDQLRAVVWEGINVGDPAIEHAITKIRKALGDEPANPRFLHTLWGKGYLFITDPIQLPEETILPSFEIRGATNSTPDRTGGADGGVRSRDRHRFVGLR